MEPGSTARVLSLGTALPGRDVPGAILDNEGLAALVNEALDRTGRPYGKREPCDPAFPAERVGVLRRRVLEEGTSVRDLARTAAETTLVKAGIDRERLHAVIVTSVTSDRIVPALAATLARAIGAPPSVVAFDLVLGCNGFVAGLEVASGLLATREEGTCALVVAAEAMTHVLDAGDRTTCPIFGDGAGALVLERTPHGTLGPVSTRTYGDSAERIQIRPAENGGVPLFRLSSRSGQPCLREDPDRRAVVTLEGPRVFRDMIRLLPALVREDLTSRGLTIPDIDRFAFHQANLRMLEAVATALHLVPDQLLTNISEVGNTTSASIPLLLDDAVATGRLTPGQRVLLVGFGTGYSIGTTCIEWE